VKDFATIFQIKHRGFFARRVNVIVQQCCDEWCKLRRPDGKPIGWGHVTKLLTMPLEDRKLRVKLQT
jgi:hypothetical protein